MSTSYVAILPEFPGNALPEDVRRSMKELLDYLTDNEYEDFEVFIDEGGDPKDHLYYHVKVVGTYLDENPSEEDRCPRCGLIDNGEANYIRDYGHCRGCHVAWQHGELPEQQDQEDEDDE